MSKFLMLLNKAFLVVTGFFALFIASAFTFSWWALPVEAASCQNKTTIYLQHSLVHADFAIPTSKLSIETRDEIILPERPGYGDPAFTVFGLGDRDIYINTPVWADLKARYAAKALFLPSDRAVHVEPAYGVYESWIPLEICDHQLSAIEDYIRASFSRDTKGNIKEMSGLSYTGYDKFYEADGVYTMFNSCNNWVNGALKAADIKAPIWSPFSQGIIYHARRHKSPVDPELALQLDVE